MRFLIGCIFGLFPLISLAQFDPAAGQPGSLAISAQSPAIASWAKACSVEPGWRNISDTTRGRADHGDSTDATGASDLNVVSLGDGGIATYRFDPPLRNRAGFDFAVFENSFSDEFLELAFVDVSTDGLNWVRFPSQCHTDTSQQLGSFDFSYPRDISQLAGKHRGGFGTPFDLDVLRDSTSVNLQSIRYIRIIDVVGSLQPAYRSLDSRGMPINDPWPTDFATGGFDLDALALLKPNVTSISPLNWPVVPSQLQPGQRLDLPGAFEASLYSLGGQQILASISRVPLDLGAGVYLLALQHRNGLSQVQQVILSR